jgi:hypothetical protein
LRWVLTYDHESLDCGKSIDRVLLPVVGWLGLVSTRIKISFMWVQWSPMCQDRVVFFWSFPPLFFAIRWVPVNGGMPSMGFCDEDTSLYIIVPCVRRKFVIIWFKVGFVPTSCSQWLILLICMFIFVVLPSSLHDKMCSQVSVCVVQLGHLLPKCEWSFCFERLLRTAATLKTCFHVKSWNIFSNLCSVAYTDSQLISSNWSGLRVPSLP